MIGYIAVFGLGLSCAMWIRWDQVQTLKEELDSVQRQNTAADRRWRGVYRHTDPTEKVQ